MQENADNQKQKHPIEVTTDAALFKRFHKNGYSGLRQSD
jgi:hypothetical protein